MIGYEECDENFNELVSILTVSYTEFWVKYSVNKQVNFLSSAPMTSQQDLRNSEWVIKPNGLLLRLPDCCLMDLDFCQDRSVLLSGDPLQLSQGWLSMLLLSFRACLILFQGQFHLVVWTFFYYKQKVHDQKGRMSPYF